MNIKVRLFMSEIFDKTLRALAASSKMRELKHNIHSGNVANAETPGYKAKKIDFEEALTHALRGGDGTMETTHEGHISTHGGSLESLKPSIYDNPEVDMGNDGNSVDLHREMTEMVENNVMYRAATQLINKKLAALKYAVSDGGH